MTTAMIILAKDVRRHAWWLVAWLVACGGTFAVMALPPDALASRFVVTATAHASRVLLFLLLVQMVVHEDPLVDSTAFWLTRPIGGRGLFAGKLLFVGLLLVVPAVVSDAMLLAVTGLLGGSHILLAIPEIVLEWVLWASVMLVIAALSSTTRGMLAAALRVALVWLAMVLLARIVLPYLRYPEMFSHGLLILLSVVLGYPTDPVAEPVTISASRTIVVSLLEVAGALATAAVLFRTRRTRVAWATIVVTLLGVAVVSTEWRWDLLSTSTTTATARPDGSGPADAGESLVLSIDPAKRTTSAMMQQEGKETNERTLFGRVVVTGLDQPLTAAISRVSGSLTFDDGTRFDTNGSGGGFSTWNPVGVAALLDGAQLVNLEHENAFEAPLLQAPVAEYLRHQGQRGRLDVVATLRLGRYRVAAELPPRPGTQFDDGVVRDVITTVARQDGDCTIFFRETQISLLLMPSVSAPRRMLFFRYNPNVLYVLRNRRRREAFWPHQGMTFGFGWPWRMRIDDATILAGFRGNPGSGPPLPPIDEAWLADADLVRIEAEPLGTIERHVVTSDFMVPVEEREPSSTEPIRPTA